MIMNLKVFSLIIFFFFGRLSLGISCLYILQVVLFDTLKHYFASIMFLEISLHLFNSFGWIKYFLVKLF